MLSFIVIPLVAFALALALTPVSMRLARAWGVVQPPRRERDIHRGVIPRMGGVAMGVAFIVAALLSRFMPVPFLDPNEDIRFTGLLIGAGITLLFGMVDDRWELPPWPQFAVQFLVAGIAIYYLIFIEVFNNPFTNREIEPLSWWLMVPLTIFWFLGTMNTVNFLDGLDGLATGVAAIASAVFAAHMIHEQQYSVALLSLALFGATLGLLPYNFNPARVFIGSSGAFFLGYTLAALAIMAGAKVATLLLVLGIPILDVAWQIISRVRRGHSPMRGDRGHLHHRLYDSGLSQRQVVLLYWAVSGSFGLLALLLPARIYKFYAILIAVVLGASLLWVLARRDRVEVELESR
jgi:UDP-GlcNAc:undecaprenyl-phosphate/decaprenyl-phosphate GlcNAc-1-phosphate transferase